MAWRYRELEAAEHVEHLARLVNRLSNITNCVHELLEAPSVLGDVHVAFDEVVEFGF
jgi:hypothetical protein